MARVRILGVNGSPRKSSTYRALELALAAARELDGVETELISLHGKGVGPCNHCDWCKRNQKLCRLEDDMEQFYPKIMDAHAILVASPVYAMNVTPQMQAFISRWRPIHHVRRGVLRDKLAAGITVGGTRHGGQEIAMSALAHGMMARGLIFIGNEPGNYSGAMVWSHDKGAVGTEEDTVGTDSLRKLGQRLARLALQMEAGRQALAGEHPVQ